MAGESEAELSNFTPSFLWLLRDFYLTLEEDGRTVSACLSKFVTHHICNICLRVISVDNMRCCPDPGQTTGIPLQCIVAHKRLATSLCAGACVIDKMVNAEFVWSSLCSDSMCVHS